MQVLGIIPARGGSKGIKYKNISYLGNKPLIQYTIDSCLKSKNLSNFIVSTDDTRIAEISKDCGAKVPFLRPKELANDNSSSFSVVKHAAEFFSTNFKIQYDAYMLLQPTTPFRDDNLIDNSIDKLKNNSSATSVISIVNVESNHPFRMYTLNSGEYMKSLINGDYDPMEPRQNLPNIYIRSGDIYLTTFQTLFKENSLIGSLPIGIKVDPKKAINIDTQIDLEVAKAILKRDK